eukprot:scaffold276513_cov24-Tisochrysis_lutea.AAC.2
MPRLWPSSWMKDGSRSLAMRFTAKPGWPMNPSPAQFLSAQNGNTSAPKSKSARLILSCAASCRYARVSRASAFGFQGFQPTGGEAPHAVDS